MKVLHSIPTLAADPALPQRDRLLDETLMVRYLSPLVAHDGEFEIQHCQRLRTKYCVGTSLRVLYELSGGGRSYRIAVRAFPTTHRAGHQSNTFPGIHAAELKAMFWIFPDDRKIKNLSVLNRIPRELADINRRQWVKSRVVGHAPEKSLTVQCLSGDERILAYAKIYAGDEGLRIFNTYTHVNAAIKTAKVDLQIPRALSYSEIHHLLLLESVPGVSLSAVPHARRENSFFHLGRTLRKLHSISPPSSVSKCARFAPDSLTRAATTISEIRPDVAAMVKQLTDQLVAQHEQFCGGEAVLLHGDVHPKNVLLSGECLFLLDLDQAAVGAAALDVGSVIAGLYFDSCVGSLTRRESSSLRNAFLTGYGPLDGPQASRSLRWHIAAALLQERALRSVTRIRIDGLQKLAETLTAAEAVLKGGVDD